MDNYLTLVVIIVTLVGVIGSALLGFARKSRASLIRLLLVAAAFVVAMFFCGAATDWALNFKLNGQTIIEIVKDKIPADFQDYVGLIIPVVQLLCQVLLCLIIFIVIDVVSLIIYAILKVIFVRKDPETGKRKGSRLIGAIFGAAHGLIFAFAFCSIFSGLVCEGAKVANIEMDGKKPIGEVLESLPIDMNKVNYEDYEASFLGKLYCQGLGDMYFSKISTAKLEKKDNAGEPIKDSETGEVVMQTVTLKGQVDALCKAVKIADEFASLKNIGSDLSGGSKELGDALKNIGNILDEASEEELELITDMINTVGDTISKQMGVPVDLSGLDLSKFDGEKEAAAIDAVANLASGDKDLNQEEVNNLVKTLSDSQIAMTVVDSMDMSTTVTGENKTMVETALNDPDMDPATKAKLQAMFGLTE